MSLSRDKVLVKDKHFKTTQQRLCWCRTCAVAKHPWQNIWNKLKDAAFQPGSPTRPYWCEHDHTVANHDQSWPLEALLRHAQGLCDLWPLLANAFWRVAELVKPICTRLERQRWNASECIDVPVKLHPIPLKAPLGWGWLFTVSLPTKLLERKHAHT